MNLNQVRDLFDGIPEGFQDVGHELERIQKDWSLTDTDVSQGYLVQFCADDVQPLLMKATLLRERLETLVNALRTVQSEGLEPPVEFPESARHLWATIDTAREIFCHRNDLPRSTGGNELADRFHDSELNGMFRARDFALQLHHEFVRGRVTVDTFEHKWRGNVLTPTWESVTAYEGKQMRDCVEYVMEALDAENKRSREALGV